MPLLQIWKEQDYKERKWFFQETLPDLLIQPKLSSPAIPKQNLGSKIEP